ncbi:MAG: antibiotic biosynthesis monooxygenase [Gammaproteobacteria bacterium]|nr:antibiotic biosynthesis monooxygenase [Gammaproteobacteria bacterium]
MTDSGQAGRDAYAAIFVSRRTPGDAGYEAMAGRMLELAARQPGFIAVDSARDGQGFGITVSYWESLEAIAAWKRVAEHREAQRLGRERWYGSFDLHVAKIEYSRRFRAEDQASHD